MNDSPPLFLQSFFGRVLRLFPRLIPAKTILRIRRGPLRGKRWVKGAGVNSYWLGIYEAEKQRRLVETIRPGAIVFDVGAHVGYYTLLAAELVGSAGHVFAFEPSPRNLRFLRQHLDLNDYQNVTVIAAAVGDHDGSSPFAEGADSTGGRLVHDGTGQPVVVVSLDQLVFKQGRPVPQVIKIDVEGGEMAVLQGARRLLTEHRVAIFLATHNAEFSRQCLQLLREFGYKIEPFDTSDLVRASEFFAYARPETNV